MVKTLFLVLFFMALLRMYTHACTASPVKEKKNTLNLMA